MNILIVSTDFPPLLGGIATYTKQIAQKLASFGNVTVVAPKFRRAPVPAEQVVATYNVARAFDPLLLREFHMLYLCAKALRQLNGKTIVFATTWFPCGLLAYCLRRIYGHPYFLATHASDFLDDKYSWRRRIKYHFRFLKRQVFTRAHGIIAVSRFTAGLLRLQGVPDKVIHVVNNGADPNLFRPKRISEVFLEENDLKGKLVLLTVCRLDPHKGVDLVLKALPSLCEEFPSLIYVVIGNGPEYRKLVRLASYLGLRDRVRFIGSIQERELVLWYNSCDIYIMLSHEIPGRTDLIEGFGISFVEAAACGKPTVACRFGGVTEAVKEGETGLFINVPPQIDEVVNIVGRLLRSEKLRKKLGQAGLRRVERELDWKFAAQKLTKIFKAAYQKGA